MIAVIFWVSLAIIIYVYAGFPVILWLLSRFFRHPVKKAPIEPFISLLIPAYNEENVIAAKIQNVLAVDYPPEKLEIVVVSDGSKDRTNEIVRRFCSQQKRIRLFDYPQNRGKIAALNDTFRQLNSEIVALSDASSMLLPNALRILVSNFADPTVGAVSGIYQVRQQREAELGEQEGFYWKYESFLKVNESAVASILGAHGSLYAIRRELYPFPAPGTINDDYVIPIRILQRGYRAIYETAAVAYEEAREMSGFQRRVRIMRGNFEQLRELKPLCWPPRWLPLFFFLSHKAGRLVVPAAMLSLLISNLFLLPDPVYLAFFIGQLAFYAIALIGWKWPLNSRLLKLPRYFCMINVAAFPGFYYAVFARKRMVWK